MEYVFYMFVGIALVILALCVLIDKLHNNNQDVHIKSKDKKIEIRQRNNKSQKDK